MFPELYSRNYTRESNPFQKANLLHFVLLEKKLNPEYHVVSTMEEEHQVKSKSLDVASTHNWASFIHGHAPKGYEYH